MAFKTNGFGFKSQQTHFRGVCLCHPVILLQSAKLVGSGLATISLGGAGVGIGILFSGFLIAVASNPQQEKQLFLFAILGFALTEAIALFGLMMAFLILFG